MFGRLVITHIFSSCIQLILLIAVCIYLLLFVQYHGSFSLRHWLQQSDWLPTLEATLALDEESVKRVGDDTIGGPAVSRQLRLIRILMRDLLIGVGTFSYICTQIHKHICCLY